MTRVKATILGSTALLGAATALSPGAQAADAGAAGLAQLAALNTVTITATLNPRSAFSYPGMVGVIDLDQIEAINPSTVADLVENMPGVEFGGGPRRTGEAPSIRGIGDQGVLILLDGARQSFVSGHQGSVFIDPALIKSVEVIRGPASALYGSGALGGVMAFETANAADFLLPGETMGLRGRFAHQGANDELLYSATGFAQIGIVDFIGSIGRRVSGDIRLGNGTELPSDDDILTGFAKAAIDFDSGTARLSYQKFHNDAVEPDNGQGNNTGSLVDKVIDAETIAGDFSWNPEGSRFLNLNITPHYTRTSVDWTNPSSGRRVSSAIDTIGIKADNRIAFDGGMFSGFFTFGGEWYSDEHDGGDSASADGERAGVPDGENSFFGAFAQIEANAENPFGLPGTISLIPGIRWDTFETSSPGQFDTDDDAVSPKFAVAYEPAPWLVLFGSYAHAFRAPGINELYLTGTHFVIPLGPGVNWTNSFMPNPNLKPERAKAAEFGAGLNFSDLIRDGDGLRVKSAYHISDVDDLINLVVTVPEAPPFTCFIPPNFTPCSAGTATSQNVDARIRGAEIEAEYENDRIALNLNYGTIEGKERGTAFDISSLTPNRFNATFVLKIPELDTSLGARVETGGAFDKNYNPATHSPDTEHRDDYSVIDVFATWQPAGTVFEGLRVDAGVENAGDAAYVRTAEGVFETGRNYKAAISYTVGW